MAEVEVAGPFRGHYLCRLPPDTTVGVTSDEDFLFNHPLGEQSREFKATGKDRFVFFKAKGKQEKQTDLGLSLPQVKRSSMPSSTLKSMGRSRLWKL